MLQIHIYQNEINDFHSPCRGEFICFQDEATAATVWSYYWLSVTSLTHSVYLPLISQSCCLKGEPMMQQACKTPWSKATQTHRQKDRQKHTQSIISTSLTDTSTPTNKPPDSGPTLCYCNGNWFDETNFIRMSCLKLATHLNLPTEVGGVKV